MAGLSSSRLRGRATRCCGRVFLVAFALTVLGAAAGAAPAAAPPPRWLTARDLSPAGADSVIPDVAVDAKGNVFVIWAQVQESSWTVEVVERPFGGTWSAPQPLSAPANHVASPQLAIAGTHVVAVWDRYDGKNLITQASERDPKTGVWSAASSLSMTRRDAQAPRIAVDAHGDEVALWASVTIEGWSVQSAYRLAGGDWQGAVSLEAAQQGTAAPDVVIDPTGKATAIWASTSGSGWRVHTSSRSAGSSWSKVFAISGPDASGSIAPQLALEKANDVTAVWARSVGTNSVLEQATRAAATGAWSVVRQISPDNVDALAPLIAVDRRGDGVLAWTNSDQSGLAVQASYRRPGKAWSAPAVLVSAGSGPLTPQVSIDAHGDAVAVWAHSTSGASRAQASTLRAGSSSWSLPRALSRPGGDALTPQVALDDDGDGAVAWARYDGQSFVVQSAGYDANGPVLEKLAVPATGVVGQRLPFAVTPRDVWSAVRTIRWSFGDGTVGSGRSTAHTYARPGRYTAQVTAVDSFGHVRSTRRLVRIAAG